MTIYANAAQYHAAWLHWHGYYCGIPPGCAHSNNPCYAPGYYERGAYLGDAANAALRLYNWRDLSCVQLHDKDEEAPVAVPNDTYDSPVVPSISTTATKEEVRSIIHKWNLGPGAKKLANRFQGAFHKDVSDDEFYVIDTKGGPMKQVHLKVKCLDPDRKVVRTTDLWAADTAGDESDRLRESQMRFCKSLDETMQNTRHTHGTGNNYKYGFEHDSGFMVAVGDALGSDGFKMCRTEHTHLRTDLNLLNKGMGEVLKMWLPSVHEKMIEQDRKNNIHNHGHPHPRTDVFGEGAHFGFNVFSKNLKNVGHNDVKDSTYSVNFLREEEPGRATDWYFILSNTYVENDGKKKPVAIKMYDGLMLVWDGRYLKHCTASVKLGSTTNAVYGVFASACPRS